MAYSTEQLYKEVIEAIRVNKLKCFDYIEGFVSAETSTLYRHFPKDCNEHNTIKRELELNKINAKNKMRNKWEESDNPTLQIAAFKLCATDEEKQSLSTNWQKTEHSGEIKIPAKITFKKFKNE